MNATSASPVARRPRRGRRLLWLFLAVLAAALLAWLGFAACRGWRAATRVLEDLNDIEALAAQPVDRLDIEAALGLLQRTRRDTDDAATIARPFLWLSPLLGWVPRYGPEIQAAPELLAIATNLTAAGDDLATSLAPLITHATAEGGVGQSSWLSEALVALGETAPQLVSAGDAIEAAREARARLNTAELGERVQGWVARLDRYLPLMAQGVDAARVLPELLGADGSRAYLVLVQNEDELRATGGFISAVVQATIENGRISDLRVEDSYAVDDFSQPYPEPPAPLREYMLADLWVFRDSNWSPDFPTSARSAVELFQVSRDAHFDGVVAIDQHTIRALVAALGALQVEGFDEAVTGDNVLMLAREAWAPGPAGADLEWWQQRKDFMADVLGAALARIEGGLDRPRAVALARAVWQMAREKHLLVYLDQPEPATVVRRLGWDGGVDPAAGDYLMVVDSNVGFNKANGLVQQEIDYTVDLRDPSGPVGALIVRHRHLATGAEECWHESRYDQTYDQMMDRCYWDYMRVLVPLGARLLSATPHEVAGADLLSGAPSPARIDVGPPEATREVLATMLLLRKGQTLETRFEYRLPPSVIRLDEGGVSVYELTVQKQPGTDGPPLRLAVLLPAMATLIASEPPPTTTDGDAATYALTLRTDQAVRLTFR